MSSFVGHALCGVAAFLASPVRGPSGPIAATIGPEGSRTGARTGLALCVLLAAGADLDYLALWLWHADVSPRVTHTLLFAVAAALLARAGSRRGGLRLPLPALLFAALSHPLLDLLVGAHPLPLLWPAANPDVATPLGVLPSAGRLAFANFYLWRNLLIELGVLLPVLAAGVLLARRWPLCTLAPAALCIAPAWLLFVGWSMALVR